MRSLFWLRRVPLRVRLTVWYVVLLGLTMTGFVGYLYFQLERHLLSQVDANLQIAASESLAHLNDESSPPVFQNTESYRDTARHLNQVGFAVRLLDLNGAFRDGFGRYQEVPTRMPMAPGYLTLTVHKTQWRLYSQPIQTDNGRMAGWLQVAQSLQQLEDISDNLLREILLSLPPVMLLAGLGGLFLANRALRPIDQITRTAQSISAIDLTRRLNYQGSADEVGRLATTFDQMIDRLQAAFNRERRFTADASHELRTPMTVIKGRIGVTLRQPRTQAEYENTLQALEQEIDRLIRLSNGLLFLARLDQGQLHFSPLELDLSNLLEAICEQAQTLAQARNITVISDIPPGMLVQGDPDHLIRLFLNLLDNAIKYSKEAGCVHVRTISQENSVQVVVSDTGPGIPKEHLPHLFERFYRVESHRASRTGGAGLGLAIAYEIAQLHGGTLSVHSRLGQGTAFTVSLPTPTAS